MRYGDAACEETGISQRHAAVFQEVANVTKCIIACRAVGKFATGLISESYSSKGFHNKAKSCNWGPMAGFVLADPRFTKSPDLKGQTKTLVAAYLAGATQVPLFISEQRRIWLQNAGLFQFRYGDERVQEVRAQREGLVIDFELHRDVGEPKALTWGMWAVMYSINDRVEALVPPLARAAAQSTVEKVGTRALPKPPSDRAQPSSGRIGPPRPALKVAVQSSSREQIEERLARINAPPVQQRMADPHLVPVMAVRDPHCTVAASDYRSATTGDYDLFAVWPRVGPAELMNHLDRRMIQTHELEQRITARKTYSYESEHQGNLTPRISEVKSLLNGGFMRAGYTGGNMVHHSDEGGRPFVTSIDLPVFAVVPGETQPYCIESAQDMRAFVRGRDDYEFPMNQGWVHEMRN
ncbi:anthrax toxin-like adenylyl cyclase domain-containing protein [Massilia sp. TSP1-1-2]|uniref:anthrax toxin-like adenylyl cyclase domain-containing protein n=1 Tax=unclassified Massilia TaxID=2609279 RepID=UPI003CE92F6C